VPPVGHDQLADHEGPRGCDELAEADLQEKRDLPPANPARGTRSHQAFRAVRVKHAISRVDRQRLPVVVAQATTNVPDPTAGRGDEEVIAPVLPLGEVSERFDQKAKTGIALPDGAELL
jgi:hypothetical protein